MLDVHDHENRDRFALPATRGGEEGKSSIDESLDSLYTYLGHGRALSRLTRRSNLESRESTTDETPFDEKALCLERLHPREAPGHATLAKCVTSRVLAFSRLIGRYPSWKNTKARYKRSILGGLQIVALWHM